MLEFERSGRSLLCIICPLSPQHQPSGPFFIFYHHQPPIVQSKSIRCKYFACFSCHRALIHLLPLQPLLFPSCFLPFPFYRVPVLASPAKPSHPQCPQAQVPSMKSSSLSTPSPKKTPSRRYPPLFLLAHPGRNRKSLQQPLSQSGLHSVRLSLSTTITFTIPLTSSTLSSS